MINLLDRTEWVRKGAAFYLPVMQNPEGTYFGREEIEKNFSCVSDSTLYEYYLFPHKLVVLNPKYLSIELTEQDYSEEFGRLDTP